MAGNEVRLANGHRWTAKQFVDHYRSARMSGTPTPVGDAPPPVDVDMSWYMGEGPGRYYHPGMFPIMEQIANNRNLAPGTYDLAKLAADDEALKARISHYATDMRSVDYPLRALVFGNESAKIYGQVEVNPHGTKTFKQIEIRPFDTNFDFEHKTNNQWLEGAREIARRIYDPENQGVRHQIQYRGPGQNHPTGRIYDAFTGSQLSAAVRKEFVYPGSRPPGLLPSITGQPPLPYTSEQLQYLEQGIGNIRRHPHPAPAELRCVSFLLPTETIQATTSATG
jgi:hypothetical protein